MEKILEVKDLCKTYIVNKRQNNVLKNVNFSIQKGEMAAVMGPSGSVDVSAAEILQSRSAASMLARAVTNNTTNG